MEIIQLDKLFRITLVIHLRQVIKRKQLLNQSLLIIKRKNNIKYKYYF